MVTEVKERAVGFAEREGFSAYVGMETEHKAILNGTLDDDGGEACDCGFEYGETISYGTTTATSSKNTGETFLQAITGLKRVTTYHFRAIATNSAGSGYGSDRTFVTL